MPRKLVGLMAVALMIAASAKQVEAQLPKGYTDLGFVIGLGGLDGGDVSFGGRFERVVKDLPSLGNGSLGIGVSLDYWGYNDNNFKQSYIPIGATANYHVKLDSKKVDLFGGAGLGYSIINCSYDDPTNSSENACNDGSVYFIVRVGGRYFFTPKVAFYADLGSGSSVFNLGLTFRLK